MSAILSLEGLTVHRGGTTAVDGLDLELGAGEIVALLGPNGAGKTTTLETIEGYLRPASGTCRVLGVDPARQRAEIAHRWGVMPQQGGLPTGMNVGEAVRLFAGLGHLDPVAVARRAEAALEVTGLTDLVGRRWRRLSGGEQQRLSLALALCGGDELLLLDEPTAAVDQEGRRRVLDVIVSRAAAGAGVLLTTHRFDDVERLADRVVILDRGAVVAAGSIADLTEGHDDITFELSAPLEPADLDALSGRLGRMPLALGDGRYRMAGASDAFAVAALTAALAEAGHVPRAIGAGRRNLEELYESVLAELDRPADEEPS